MKHRIKLYLIEQLYFTNSVRPYKHKSTHLFFNGHVIFPRQCKKIELPSRQLFFIIIIILISSYPYNLLW